MESAGHGNGGLLPLQHGPGRDQVARAGGRSAGAPEIAIYIHVHINTRIGIICTNKQIHVSINNEEINNKKRKHIDVRTCIHE